MAMTEQSEQARETELHKRAADMVQAMFVMEGRQGDLAQGTSFYNNLERHTDLNDTDLLSTTLLGAITDFSVGVRVGVVNDRLDMVAAIWGGCMIHYYQGKISSGRGGRKEAVEVLKAIALERQAMLEAKGGTLDSLARKLHMKH